MEPVSKVFMSPKNGNIFVAIPLKPEYQLEHNELIMNNVVGIFVAPSEPLAYAVDIGEEQLTFLSAEFIEEEMIPLGDL